MIFLELQYPYKDDFSYSIMSEKLSVEKLETYLFDAADILRKSLNASENSKPVMALLFLKRLNDVFAENAEKLVPKYGKKEAYGNKRRHSLFFVPEEARWEILTKASSGIGSKLIQVCKAVEKSSDKLEGTMTYSEFNNKNKYPDTSLRKLIALFDGLSMRNSDLDNPDVFGDAFEYLLGTFADETKKKGGQFYTPREVVRLLVQITQPQLGDRICDPACGSGGMLIHSRRYVEDKLKKQKKSQEEIEKELKDLTLRGQDSNPDTVNMCKMNMVLHGILDFVIEDGDVVEIPKFTSGGKLDKFHKVLANFPFSENWDSKKGEKDSYNRFAYGIPPSKGKADYAFIQHMLAILNEKGKAAIVSSQGVLFRGDDEEEIRKKMILGDPDNNLQGDVIECIIALPNKLFYGTPIPACILVLNKNKAVNRKNKILFIYAAKEFVPGSPRNKLGEENIKKIADAYKDFKDIDKYCHVAELDELEENEYNLNVPRYVDISEPEEPIDIQETIGELKKLEKEGVEIQAKVEQDLKELKFKI